MGWLFDFVFVDVFHFIAFDYFDSTIIDPCWARWRTEAVWFYSLLWAKWPTTMFAACVTLSASPFSLNERTNNQKPSDSNHSSLSVLRISFFSLLSNSLIAWLGRARLIPSFSSSACADTWTALERQASESFDLFEIEQLREQLCDRIVAFCKHVWATRW